MRLYEEKREGDQLGLLVISISISIRGSHYFKIYPDTQKESLGTQKKIHLLVLLVLILVVVVVVVVAMIVRVVHYDR